MTKREAWRRVLDAELKRWSALPWDQLLAELQDVRAYEVERDGLRLQVEVELLENTAEYLHVLVAVDDGSLPASLVPCTQSFLCAKPKA